MSSRRYGKLLVRMFILESLGEELYKVLCWRCEDPDLKSVYAELALNEKRTRSRIESEAMVLEAPLPKTRARVIAMVARWGFRVMPSVWLRGMLESLLAKRAFRKWHRKHWNRNPRFWDQLLAHERLQRGALGLSKGNEREETI